MSVAPLIHETVAVAENVPMARATYRLRFESPRLAELIRPGQFIMLRVGRISNPSCDPLLGRAFALFDTAVGTINLVYLVVGKMTGLMAGLGAGDRMEVWGPLGNGFPDYTGVDHLIMVAGGIGQTPFPALIHRVLGKRGYGGQAARREVQRASLYYGVRSRDLVAGVAEFKSAGAEVHLASDDGSVGFKGLVTQFLDSEKSKIANQKSKIQLVGCGPEPMLHALAGLAEQWGVPCDLSLETPMACGVGICFSCVTKVKTATGWDYRRVCVDGPVFDAGQLVW